VNAPRLVAPIAARTNHTYRIHNADTILIIRDGVTIDQMTPEQMIANAQMMIQQARRAMEMRPKVAEQMAFDSAILLRAGASFGLTSNPKILDMAKTEAESNRDLRRYMPGGIKGEEQFGRPGVRHVDTGKPSK